ncbi:MAG: DNA-binding protein WhiA [Clostridia bacterium]|nr:DNA-binding protein WhiA [Clostridia bacterium]MBQ9847759.1 DNA-binding protein WhiA [Clostridia bacterium]
MSFSSDIKSKLSELETKKKCCSDSVEAGKAFSAFESVCEKDCGCYLRGVFLKCGSVSAPGRNFMLSFSLPDSEYADYVEFLLDSAGLTPKRTLRRGKPLLYYKASESIEDVLSFIGATKAALDIISAKVMSDVRNTANRLCNAETANLDRTAKAAAEQCEAIKLLERYGALANLSPELRECAELRIANPDMSLEQLRSLLREPVSKSGLNHRLKKLIEIAEAVKQ